MKSHGDEVIGSESRFEQLHLVETLQHETRADEQKGRDGNLRKSEYPERAATTETRARSFPEKVDQPVTRRGQCGTGRTRSR